MTVLSVPTKIYILTHISWHKLSSGCSNHIYFLSHVAMKKWYSTSPVLWVKFDRYIWVHLSVGTVEFVAAATTHVDCKRGSHPV